MFICHEPHLVILHAPCNINNSKEETQRSKINHSMKQLARRKTKCNLGIRLLTSTFVPGNITDDIVTLLRALENMPYALWHIFERFFESLGFVLFFDANGSNVCDLPDEDQVHPARESAESNTTLAFRARQIGQLAESNISP